jgi:cysteine synthase A
MQQLGEEYFPAINNAELIGKDTCAYRPEWELAAKSFAATLEKDMALEKDKQRTLLIDIRKKKDFEMSRLPFANAINIDISSLQLEKPNPFKDAPTLVKQWDALNAKLGPKNEMLKKLHPMLGENEKDRTQVICMCYDGNTAKVATSILRARGINADYVATSA